jgi:uncharacterized membrane protein
MSQDTASPQPAPAHSKGVHTIHHLPALGALLAIGVIFAVVAEQLAIGPPWLLLGLIVVLIVMSAASLLMGRHDLRRRLGFVILAVVTAGEVVSTGTLVAGLVGTSLRISQLPHETAIGLLRDAALIWLVNTLTFALWYWELDAGGPGQRLHKGYRSRDFVFPQVAQATPGSQGWCPHFLDYLFLAFNTSTAFSPTDTTVLSRRAKLLMMLQALISLVVLAVIAARAINTL